MYLIQYELLDAMMPSKYTMTILIDGRDCRKNVERYYALDHANRTYNV